MKILSHNCRGLESTQKKLSLKRMLSVQKPDVFLLQETLGKELEVTNLFSSITNNFTFLSQSAKGLSGGMAIGWNQSTTRYTNSWGALFGMGIQISWEEENLSLKILNIYGPYNNRVTFWEALQSSHILRCENMVINGDLNFTLGAHEIWEPKARVDPLSSFFSNILQSIKMVDLDPQSPNQPGQIEELARTGL